MKAQEYRTLSDAELAKSLKDLKAELFNLRFSNSTGSLANPMAINECKKNIAKVSTVIRERELGLSKAPVDAPKPKKAEAKTAEKAPVAAKKATATTKKAAPKKEKVEKILV